MRILAATVLALLPLIALAGPLDDKTPAYFVDRYGPAKSSKVQSTASFTSPSRGAVTVKGQFSVREFRDGDLRVTAVFFYPSLKPAAVRLQLNRAWTKEQVEAALAAYGGSWQPASSGNPMIKAWVAPDETLAFAILTWVDFQSKEIVALVEKFLAESDAKRKAVPKL